MKYSFPGFKTAEFRKYAKSVLAEKHSIGELRKYAFALLKQGDYGSCLVASYVFRADGVLTNKEKKKIIYQYADSSDWAVRETGAGIVGVVLEEDFERWFPFVKAMVRDRRLNIRRAAVVGCMNSGFFEKRAEQIVRFVFDPCINDGEVYMRKNLGPFAIGSFLLRKWPDLTYKWMDKWIVSGKNVAIWNVLNAFHATALKRSIDARKKAVGYLKTAEKFDDKLIQSAVKSLRRRLLRLLEV